MKFDDKDKQGVKAFFVQYGDGIEAEESGVKINRGFGPELANQRLASLCFLTAVLLMTSACATTPKEKAEFHPRIDLIAPMEPAGDSPPYLLEGYDSLTGARKNRRCVQVSAPLVLPPIDVAGGVAKQFRAYHYSEREDLIERLAITVAARVGIGPVSIGGATNLVREFTRTALHQALAMDAEVSLPTRELPLQNGFTLTSEAKGFLADGSFFRECGDRFIFGDSPGGSFRAAYVFRSLSTKDDQLTSADVDIAASVVNIGGASANFSNAVTKASTRSLTFREFVSKGPDDPDPKTPDELFSYGANFVANVKKKPWIMGFLSADYGTLVDNDSWAKWDRHRSAALTMLDAMAIRIDQETALQLLKEQSSHEELGYVFPAEGDALLQELKANNDKEKERVATCLSRANCDQQDPVPVDPLRVTSPLTVTLLDPSVVGDLLITRRPLVVTELLGRWKATDGGNTLVCAAPSCTRNSFSFHKRDGTTTFTAIADRACAVPADYDTYVNINASNLKNPTSDPISKLRVLTYPALSKDVCVWAASKP